MPQTRTEYWQTKIERNIIRDQRNLRAIEELGWVPFVIWECELDLGTEKLLNDLTKLRPEEQFDNSISLT
jgi:DNA mismatch endonuclease, patch repair protein